MKEHRSDLKEWVDDVARMRVQGPFTYTKARQIEREALRTEYPQNGSTPQRISARSRRNSWIKRRQVELIEEFGGFETTDEYLTIYALAAEEADAIDWDTIAEAAIARRHPA